jgi:FtsP/CotA-like multicopper oxidase with cupredoxin domain
MRPTRALTLASSLFLVGSPTTRLPERPLLTPNPNTVPAGSMHEGVLTIDLDVVVARWHVGGGAPSVKAAEAFAERGKAPSMPGPLVRVPAGTPMRFSVRNTLARPIAFYVPASPTMDDSIIVAPGATAELRARAAKPGNYVYRATDGGNAGTQMRVTGALAGAFVVDSAGTTRPPNDRVMVIQMVPDSMLIKQADTLNIVLAGTGIFAFTINGRSWPSTERISATVGDTVHWRVINASPDVHPMHLHGFYFRVDEFTGLLADREGQGAPGRMVVTERMSPFSGMSMTWVPERAGNWLFHCHFAIHLEPPAGVMDHTSHENHALTGMVGLVVGLSVAPRPGATAAADPTPARRLRLIAIRDSGFTDSAPSMRFVLEEKGRRTQAGTAFSPTIHLTKNEPVAITVVNGLRERTAVHWHGIELESYYDGVAGLSGTASRLAPVIVPGDSFVARFTPPRAGTFIYHSHVDEVRQHSAGLAGALIVHDGPAAAEPGDHEFFLKGARDANAPHPVEINGEANPDTIVLAVGRPIRLRFMSLAIFNPNATVSLTARPDSSFKNLRDTMLVRWRPVAKDGADLPAGARVDRSARQVISMGETYDFSYTPTRRGNLRVEVRAIAPNGVLFVRVPIRVE